MSNEDGSIWIVFNGESLQFSGDSKRSEAPSVQEHSDTEVILHAYEEWGSMPSVDLTACLHLG